MKMQKRYIYTAAEEKAVKEDGQGHQKFRKDYNYILRIDNPLTESCKIVFKDMPINTVCPITKLPDHNLIEIVYVPNKYTVELISVRRFLREFYKNTEILNEEAAQSVFNEFKRIVEPAYLKVTYFAGGADGQPNFTPWTIELEYKENA